MAAIPGTSANDSDRVHKVSSEAGKAAAGVCQKLPERRKKADRENIKRICAYPVEDGLMKLAYYRKTSSITRRQPGDSRRKKQRLKADNERGHFYVRFCI